MSDRVLVYEDWDTKCALVEWSEGMEFTEMGGRYGPNGQPRIVEVDREWLERFNAVAKDFMGLRAELGAMKPFIIERIYRLRLTACP